MDKHSNSTSERRTAGTSRRTATVLVAQRRPWLIGLMLGLALASGALFADAANEAEWRVVPIGEAGLPYEAMQSGKQGGTLRLVCFEGPMTWNDAVALDPYTPRFTNLIFRGLVVVNPITGDLLPDLAASYKVSEDGRWVDFRLREGVYWSDGTPFTADDVLFTFNDIIMNDDVNAAYRARLYPGNDLPKMVASDDGRTITVDFGRYFRPLLRSFTFNILPKHKLERYVHKLNPETVERGTFSRAWGLDTDPEELCAIGPYMLKEYVSEARGEKRVVLERNPEYYAQDSTGTQLPYYDTVEYRICELEDDAIFLFQVGGADYVETRGKNERLLGLASYANARFTADLWESAYEMIWFYVNQDIGLSPGSSHEETGEMALYRDPRFRQALAHCVNRTAMVKGTLHGGGSPLWGVVPPVSKFYAGHDGSTWSRMDESGRSFEEAMQAKLGYDLDAAGRILDDLGVIDCNGDGWRDLPTSLGFTITIYAAEGQADISGCAHVLQDGFAEVGIHCYVETGLAREALWGQMVDMHGGLDAVVFAVMGSPEPNDLAAFYLSDGPLHLCRQSAANQPSNTDKEIDGALIFGAAPTLYDNVADCYYDMQNLMAEDAAFIPLVNPSVTYAYYDYVGNANVSSALSSPISPDGRLVEVLFDRRL